MCKRCERARCSKKPTTSGLPSPPIGPRRPPRPNCWNWRASTGASKMDNTIAEIAPRTRTAARCVTPPPRAICPSFGPWPFFSSRRKPRTPMAKNPCPTLSATFTANLGASSADSPNHGMRSEPGRQTTSPSAGILRVALRALPRAPPVDSKKKVPSTGRSKLGANQHIEAPTGFWPTDSHRACGDFVTGRAGPSAQRTIKLPCPANLR